MPLKRIAHTLTHFLGAEKHHNDAVSSDDDYLPVNILALHLHVTAEVHRAIIVKIRNAIHNQRQPCYEKCTSIVHSP